jgi:predicted DNA-binding protein with PD1-like motif
MKAKRLDRGGSESLYVAILDPGEEAFAAIEAFARHEQITAASVSAIGAFERAVVGWFDVAAKNYRRVAIDEQCEVLSALGDIAIDDDGRVSLHLHAVLGLSDGTTRGGHFLEGIVRPTLEVMVTETPAQLRRKRHKDLGVSLIDLSKD